MARVQVVNEVSGEEIGVGEWVLCLQWCRYIYDDGNMEQGYRFIYKDENGKLRPQRGQARIPSLEDAKKLIEQAEKAGWGDYEGDK